MPASFWERDAEYRRRIALLVPIVLAAFAALFLSSDKFRFEEIPRYVGWRGDLELLPEITVISEVTSRRADPAPQEESVEETVALDLAELGEVVSAPPRIQPKESVVPSATEAFRSVENPGKPRVSYSDDYVLLKYVEPVYPARERAMGIEGNVTVELLVDVTGVVAQASVLDANGPVSFQDAALDAVQQFLFEPPTFQGRPSAVWVRFRITFRLE
jgi:TonB family protein